MLLSFPFPIIYTFLHGKVAAIVFAIYFAVWVAIEWRKNVKIYMKSKWIQIKIRQKDINLFFFVFTVCEIIVTLFGIYVSGAAIFIK